MHPVDNEELELKDEQLGVNRDMTDNETLKKLFTSNRQVHSKPCTVAVLLVVVVCSPDCRSLTWLALQTGRVSWF